MARLSQPPGAPINRNAIDLAASELGHLLLRLQQTILHADPDRERRLRISEFERARVAANLEYARTSLTTLEQDALGIKAPGRRSEVQGDLNRKREMLELLLDRLEDLREMAIEDDDASSDGEDILSEIIPTPSDSMADSISTDMRSESSGQDDPADSEPPELPAGTPVEPEPVTPAVSWTQAPEPAPSTDSSPEPPTQTEPTQTTQILRSRGGASTPAGSGRSTARAALFSNRRKASAPETSTATAEAILDRQRAEQDELSNSILKMAGALKESSQRFSNTLESDKEVLSRAGDGMEKTEVGMEAAQGRMGTLRKMTEGKGWWGRMILFAWVYGLMVALILLVFVMPKLRF
ncbi:hypothetical protein EDB81DRAFT_796972 [Dactylonectria macrodidyma]|uniref:Synaptobrevin n=1 Tax=Dactylonectria macrodidyma TaxID=307937 RepID=A0A9P9EU19_9HYPO|nr:hypothetical protein EDB81DRAFT_796972 [Dactylonectria macrodidyma]